MSFSCPCTYLNRSTNWPMTLAIYNFFGQYQSDWSLVSADIVLTILPVIVIYLFAQRFILSGIDCRGGERLRRPQELEP